MSMLKEINFNMALKYEGFFTERETERWEMTKTILVGRPDKYVDEFIEFAKANHEGKQIIVGCISHVGDVNGLRVDYKVR